MAAMGFADDRAAGRRLYPYRVQVPGGFTGAPTGGSSGLVRKLPPVPCLLHSKVKFCCYPK